MGLRKRPSDAYRWSRCSLALSFTKDYPNTSTTAADEGTAAHWIREQCLLMGLDPWDFLDWPIHVNGAAYECDEDMCHALQPGIDAIRERDHTFGLFVEIEVDVTHITGPGEDGRNQTGTLDCGWIGVEEAGLSDLKYGRGVPVEAVDNDQQVMYLDAFYEQFVRLRNPNVKRLVVLIDQPRNSAGGGEWGLTIPQLKAAAAKLRAAAKRVESPDACLTAGLKQCSFCPAANVEGRLGGCPAHASWVTTLIDMEVDNLEEWEPPTLAGWTPERIAQVVINESAITKFIGYCKAMTMEYVMEHGPVADRKVVLGNEGRRNWVNADVAELYLLETIPASKPIFNKKLISPAQAAKTLGRKQPIPSTLIMRNPAKPILVHVDDKRPAYHGDADVDNLDDDTDDLSDL